MHKLAIVLLIISMFSGACTTPKRNNSSNNSELTMLVGTYTSSNGSQGIYTFRFNEEDGSFAPLGVTETSNPSYLTLSADGRYVYAVNENEGKDAAVTAFALNKDDGTLKLLNTRSTVGGAPCYIMTDGKRVVTANYSGGNISVLPIRYDGSLDTLHALYEGGVGGTDMNRQADAHVHCVHLSPDSNYIFATDFSADRILKYAINSKDEKLFPIADSIQLAPESGPRHLIFSQNGKYAYLINELSGKVNVFDYNDGRLTAIQTVVADTLAARGSADIQLSPDGRYLYASNRLKGDGIAIFEVDQNDGTLMRVGYQLTGGHPRNFIITPNGKFMLVACRDKNAIEIFSRDICSGELTNTGKSIALSKPVCIKFAQ